MKLIEEVNRYVNLLAAMERALKTANLPIIFTDAGLKRPGPRIVFANKAFCASTGYTEKELLGQSPRLLQGPRTDPALLKRLAEHLKNGMPFAGQTINYRKDGTPYSASWNICPICDDNGKVTHYVSFQTHAAAPKR
jgi:PAS domain S-box-containing protein